MGTVLFFRVSIFAVSAFYGFALLGCSGNGGEKAAGSNVEEAGAKVVIEKTGVIEPGDSTDPNHGNLAYDAYKFEARPMSNVRAVVSTKDFSPLLKLVEVATGAVLAEWDAAYPTGDALTYTIAGPGTYEVRVYAMGGDTGSYSIKITATR